MSEGGTPSSSAASRHAGEDVGLRSYKCSVGHTACCALLLLLLLLLSAEHPAARAAPQLRSASRCPGCSTYASVRAFILGEEGRVPRPHTSYSCTAGSQAFEKPWHVFTNNYREPSWEGFRMCLVRDVCLVGGEPTFYVEEDASVPEPLRLSSLVRANFLYAGPYEATVGTPFKPRVVQGPRPAHLPFAPPGRLYVQTSLNNAQNFAHLLLDTILPAYAAADFYGLGVEDVQHVGLTTCSTFPNNGWVSKGGASFSASCYENFNRWYEPLMPHPYLDGRAAGDVCFEAMVMGQDALFSSALFGGHTGRARAVRAMRERALAFAAAAAEGSSGERRGGVGGGGLRRRVQVLMQYNPTNAPSALGDLCELVKEGLQGRHGLDVQCSVPGAQSLADQLRDIREADLAVCEHGSTCYAALFLSPGAALLSIVPSTAPTAKEGHVLLFLSDVAVLYLEEGRARIKGELQGALALALQRAGAAPL